MGSGFGGPYTEIKRIFLVSCRAMLSGSGSLDMAPAMFQDNT